MDGEQLAGFIGGGNHLPQFLRVHGDGFFAHHVFTGPQAGDDKVFMYMVRGGDGDELDGAVLQKLIKGGIGV